MTLTITLPHRHSWLKYFASALLGLAACLAQADQPERACRFGTGPSNPANIFEPAEWPMDTLAHFAQGRMGIVRPTYDHYYLFIAYRRLQGLPITAQDLNRLRPFDPCWSTNSQVSFYDFADNEELRTAISLWQAARDKLVKPQGEQIDATYHPDSYYGDFLNCNKDAFRNAAKTLAERTKTYGFGPDVRDWILGQDQVFKSCKKPAALPVAAKPSAPGWLQQDRDYQIAAALFYGKRYAEAAQKFDAIAQSADSPWRTLAAYLATRALIRKVTAEHRGPDLSFEEQEAADIIGRLNSILAQPAYQGLHADAARLLQFVQLRTAPEAVLEQLESRLGQALLPDSAGQDLADFWMAYRKGGGETATLPFSNWLTQMRSKGGLQNALDLWRSTQQPAWLVAALTLATEHDPEAAEALRAAQQLTPASPAYITARYHLARLSRDPAKVQQIVNAMLADKQVPLSVEDTNAFRRLGLASARTPQQVARFVTRNVAYVHGGIPPQVDADAAGLLNLGLPLDYLLTLHADRSLPEAFRKELTIVLWTRAFVLGRWDVTNRLAPDIKRQIPATSALLDDMLKAQDVASRRAIGAMLMARFPGFVGNVRSEIIYMDDPAEIAPPQMHASIGMDGSRDNWWCGFPSGNFWYPEQPEMLAKQIHSFEAQAAPLLSKAVATQRDKEQKLLRDTPNATDYLSQIAMGWAKLHPTDPRLPESLHMLVRSSRGGCVKGGYSAAMFQHLHKYFRRDKWTKLTRYHY